MRNTQSADDHNRAAPTYNSQHGCTAAGWLTVEFEAAVLNSVRHHKGALVDHGAVANGEAVGLLTAKQRKGKG